MAEGATDRESVGAESMAMFPLGSVVLPGMALPLHIFEPRYRALARHVVHGDGGGEFGVVLIERGSEVGGGEVRSDLGVIARVVDATELDDGRWQVVAVGTDRLRVDEWLSDDPYPRARVARLPATRPSPSPDQIERLVTLLRALGALSTQLGHPVPDPVPHLDPDPDTASWQMISLSPLGASDRQRLLACDDTGERMALAEELLDDQRALFEALVAQRDD